MQLKLSSLLSFDGVPPIAVLSAASPVMVEMSVVRAEEVGALTVIDPTVFASPSSYTTFPE